MFIHWGLHEYVRRADHGTGTLSGHVDAERQIVQRDKSERDRAQPNRAERHVVGR